MSSVDARMVEQQMWAETELLGTLRKLLDDDLAVPMLCVDKDGREWWRVVSQFYPCVVGGGSSCRRALLHALGRAWGLLLDCEAQS